MCGICGYSGKGQEKVLKSMADAIVHRGPDEEGIYISDELNLCTKRLSIVDVEYGKQPMSDGSGKVHLVWNGEVYNHREIREQLEKRGHRFVSDHSDTEVLLHSYLEYGDSFVKKLNGMFAIAIWDQRKKCLFLYRDRMGVKPLYYCQLSSGQLVFASEIKSILKHPEYEKKINDKALYQYFSYKHINAPDTAFVGIKAMLPGEKICYQGGQIKSEIWWSLQEVYGRENKEYMQGTTNKTKIAGIIECLRDLLEDAVRIRLQADVEVGSFLSGGLDSSLLSVLAAKHTPQLSCFTLGHQVAQKQTYDKQADVEYAKKLAAEKGMKHTVYTMTAKDLVERMDDIVRAFDQPFSGAVSTYMMAEVASKQVKTALSGDGADELFGSYASHMVSFPMEYIKKCKETGAKIDIEKLKPLEEELPYLQAIYEFSKGEETKISERMLVLTDEEKQLFLGERFLPYALKKETSLQVSNYRKKLMSLDALNRNLEYDSMIILPNQVLTYSDSLSMAHSLELRTPFLDYRLVEYVAGISGQLKMLGGETKYLLKVAAQQYLPPKLIYRKKEGFVMPVNDWLSVELKEYVLDTLSFDALEQYGYLPPEKVYFILKKYYEDPVANSGLADMIWNFVCFQKWCEAYV